MYTKQNNILFYFPVIFRKFSINTTKNLFFQKDEGKTYFSQCFADIRRMTNHKIQSNKVS